MTFSLLIFVLLLFYSTNAKIPLNHWHITIISAIIFDSKDALASIHHTQAQTVHRRVKVCYFILFMRIIRKHNLISIVSFTEVIRSEGKRRRFPRTVEQCEREILRLQSSLDAIRSHRGEEIGSDLGGRDSNDDLSMQPHSDIKMRNIIAK